MQYDKKAGIKKPSMNWIIVQSHKTQKSTQRDVACFLYACYYKYKRYLGLQKCVVMEQSGYIILLCVFEEDKE